MGKEEFNEKIRVLFWCFVIFSILGMIMEMIFCYVTTGVIESRQGLVWGPFCPIYGVGAIIAIVVLSNVKGSNVKLFIYGAILGGVIEYVLSYILESMYGTRFWDYSYRKYNLNGRICMLYSVFWGILGVIVVKIITPKMGKFIKNRFNNPNYIVIEKMLFVFLVFDAVCTVWAVSSYKTRAKNVYYNKKQDESYFDKIEENLFSDDYMLRAFPNIRFRNNKGEDVFIKNIINNNRS